MRRATQPLASFGAVRVPTRRGDQRALAWLRRTDHGRLRPLLTITARAADVLAPWIVASLRPLARGPRDARRAVARGWLAMAVAALVEDAVVKPLTGRDRPDADRLPPGERRSTEPSTSGFPSGHVGAATAFSVATGSDLRGLQPALAVTAVLVAYARVYTGRHYLSDAVVGSCLGVAAGLLARRVPEG